MRLELTSWLLGRMVLPLAFRGALPKALFRSSVHYLPASRAEILHSCRSVAKALISLASMAPIRGVEVLGMPGLLADFLGELMSPKPRRRAGTIESVARSLEEEILEGEAALLRRPPEAPPALVSKFNGGELPIARASSIIAEAIIILLEYRGLEPGDTLILEEPEAHLHPDKQAKLAVLPARLANEAGMRLLITTHSEILLAEQPSLAEAEELGYRPSTVLPGEGIRVQLRARARRRGSDAHQSNA